MKKIFTVLIVVFALSGYAQDSHMALTFGPSFPLGSYASKSDYLIEGYANPGFNLAFNGNYIPTWYWGIGGALAFSTNFPNQDSMLNGLITELRDLGIPEIPESVNKSVSIGNWSYVNILVGPTLALPANKFQFNLKAFLGVSIVIPPSQSLTIYYDDDSSLTGYFEDQTVAFCYSVGADIIYKLRGNYSLVFGADYTGTKSDYEVIVEYGNVSVPSIPRKIDIHAIHSYVGFAYLF